MEKARQNAESSICDTNLDQVPKNALMEIIINLTIRAYITDLMIKIVPFLNLLSNAELSTFNKDYYVISVLKNHLIQEMHMYTNNYPIGSDRYFYTAFINSINELYSKRIDYFYKYIMGKHEVSYEKTIDHLFFPRSKIENSSERPFDYKKVYETIGNEYYIEYDTMETTDYIDQIRLLAASKNVYLDFGSSFTVNGLFCKDSTIYLTDTHGVMNQIDEFICHKIVYDKIAEKNKIIVLPR